MNWTDLAHAPMKRSEIFSYFYYPLVLYSKYHSSLVLFITHVSPFHITISILVKTYIDDDSYIRQLGNCNS